MKILNGKIFQWRNILLERHFEGSDKAETEELSWQCVTAPNYLVTETFYHLTKSCSYLLYIVLHNTSRTCLFWYLLWCIALLDHELKSFVEVLTVKCWFCSTEWTGFQSQANFCTPHISSWVHPTVVPLKNKFLLKKSFFCFIYSVLTKSNIKNEKLTSISM